MSEVETQLREYFDAAVERVIAEDILAGRRVTEKIHPSRPRWRPRPIWVAAATFAATILAVGGLVGLGAWIRRPLDDAASGGFRDTVDRVVGGTATWWPVGILAGAGVLVLALIVMKRQRRWRKEKAMATTIDQPTSDRRLETAQRNNRWLIGLLVALAVALVALAAWVIFDQAQTADTAGPQAVADLVDDYQAAWNGYDGDAFMALTTEDYIHVNSEGEYGRTTQASTIRGFAKALHFQVEQVGDPVVIGDGPYYVTVANRLDSDAYADDLVDHVGISTFVVVETADGLKVAEHHFVGNG